MKTGKTTTTVSCCSPRHKLFSIIALVGLFICGWMVGVSVMGGGDTSRDMLHIRIDSIDMSFNSCNRLHEAIVDSVKIGCSDQNCVERIRMMDEVYAAKCIKNKEEPKQPEPKKEEQWNPYAELDARIEKPVCQVYEEMQIENLQPEYAMDPEDHETNINIYQALLTNGCPENVEKYRELLARENALLHGLKQYDNNDKTDESRPCVGAEMVLNEELEQLSLQEYDERERIYNMLAERGCVEQRHFYQMMAEQNREAAKTQRDIRSIRRMSGIDAYNAAQTDE